MDYGKRLKECRKHTKHNQEDFAKLIGVSKRALASYESSQQKPGFDALAGYQKAGFNIHWVISGEGDMFFNNAEFAENSHFANKISELMMLIYETIDEYLEQEDKEMAPREKTELVKSIYNTLNASGKIDLENAPSNVKSIVDIIRRAA